MKEGFSERFEPVLPLDRLILEFLPDEGSMFAGIYPIGESVKAMKGKIGKGQAGSGVFTARIRLLHQLGWITPVKAPGQGNDSRAWQVTAAGKKQLREWQGGDAGEQ